MDVGSKREEEGDTQIKLKANELVDLTIRRQGTVLRVVVSVARIDHRNIYFA